VFWELGLGWDMAGRTESGLVMLAGWLVTALLHTFLLLVYCWRLVADRG